VGEWTHYHCDEGVVGGGEGGGDRANVMVRVKEYLGNEVVVGSGQGDAASTSAKAGAKDSGNG